MAHFQVVLSPVEGTVRIKGAARSEGLEIAYHLMIKHKMLMLWWISNVQGHVEAEK